MKGLEWYYGELRVAVAARTWKDAQRALRLIRQNIKNPSLPQARVVVGAVQVVAGRMLPTTSRRELSKSACQA